MSKGFSWNLDLLEKLQGGKSPEVADVPVKKKRENDQAVTRRSHRRTRKLSPLDKLRVACWVSEIEARASAVAGRPVPFIETLKLYMFSGEIAENVGEVAKLESMPVSLLDVYEIAKPAGAGIGSDVMPFSGTRELFVTGPDGLPLWALLESSDTSSILATTLVNQEIEDITDGHVDEYISFEKKLKYLLKERIPENIPVDYCFDMISNERDYDTYIDFNVIANSTISFSEVRMAKGWEYVSTGNMWAKKESVVFFSPEKVLNSIALFVMAMHKKELVPQAYYILVGVLSKAIKDEIMCGNLIAQYFEDVIGVPKFLKI